MKSLELNWLRGHDKSLVIPEVVITERDDVGGRYLSPQKGEMFIGGKYYPLDFGLIEISDMWNDFEHQSALAHEWRHHWQLFNHGNWIYRASWAQLISTNDYDTSIVRYFTLNEHEMDALRFEYKTVGVPELWEELLYDHLKS
jgi:hypothetical protein